MVAIVLRKFGVKVQYTLPSARSFEKIDNDRIVTNIQRQLRKGDALRINYSTLMEL